MAIWLREDTAVTIVIGPFVDPTTPATEEEALTINQAAVRLSKNGGAFAQKNDATTATHMENGFYSCPLNATDTSTPGSLVVAVDDASALIWWKEYHVVPQQVWDSFLSTDRLQVHAAEISNDLITASAIANGAIDAATFAAGAITATVIATDAIDADAIADNAINAGAIATGAITNTKFAAGAIDAAAIAADAITASKVADGTIDAATFAANSITASALAADAVAEIADGVWDEDIDAAHQTANTAGKRLDDASTTISTNLNDSVADIQTDVTAILADTNELQTDWANGGRLDLILDASSTFDHTTDQVLLTTATQDQINAIEASFSGVGVTFVTTGSPTTTSVPISGTNLGDTTGDHNRQLCVFTSGGDGVVGVARWITTFTATGEGAGTLAFSGSADTPDAALPNAPAAGVTGIIVGRR